MSIFQVLRDFGTDSFEESPLLNNNIDYDANNTILATPTMEDAGTLQSTSSPTTSPPAPAAVPTQPNAEAAVPLPRNVTSVEHLLNSMATELGRVLDATSAQPSAVSAPDVQSDDGFHEVRRAGRARSPDRQDPAIPSSMAPQQTPTSYRARLPRQSHALTEYKKHLATLLALAEDARHTPSASNKFTPPNPFVDRFVSIGSLMKSYRNLPDHEIGMENTTIGHERGRLQQIVNLQWQVLENGLTGDIMELDRVMRRKNRDNDHDQDSRSDSGSDNGESSGGETAPPREVEWEMSSRDGARPARGRSERVYNRGGRGRGRGARGGRGRGSQGRWDSPSRSRNVGRGRSGAPSPDNFNRGSSGSHGGEERGWSREPTSWDDAPSLDSRPGRSRSLEDLGLSMEEMAFIMSGPVDPASANAPVVESTEIEGIDNEDQDGSDDFRGEGSEHGDGHEEESGQGNVDIENNDNYYDDEDVEGDNEERYEAEYLRAIELSVAGAAHMQDVDSQDEHEQEAGGDGSALGGQEGNHDMDTGSVTTTLVDTWNEAPTDPRDQGREERSMSRE
jgi:hypothetical protein